MPRTILDSRLRTRSKRLDLPKVKKPVFVKVAPKISLGYRRTTTNGTWVVRVADGKGANWTKAFAVADDFADANGADILDYWQAQTRARIVANQQTDEAKGGSDIMVAAALDRYERDIRDRSGDVHNVNRVRLHLPDALKGKLVSALSADELTDWRASLQKDLTAATANRIGTILRAALNLAADRDTLAADREKRAQAITNRNSWRVGLKPIRGATQSRNVILKDDEVRRIVAEAYKDSPQLGLLVEVAAVTGARADQIARLQVGDLERDRLNIPVSHKGKGDKKILHRPVPIPASLVERLKSDRAVDAPLLVKPNGAAWAKSNHARPFQRIVKQAGLDPAIVTMNALRHSSITRQILAGVPIRIVATSHDTSLEMIERTYSRFISDHSDKLQRVAMLTL
jgi:integrase